MEDHSKYVTPHLFITAAAILAMYFYGTHSYFGWSLLSSFLTSGLVAFVLFIVFMVIRDILLASYTENDFMDYFPLYPTWIASLTVLGFTVWTYFQGADNISAFEELFVWIYKALLFFMAGFMIGATLTIWWLVIRMFAKKKNGISAPTQTPN